MLQVFLYHDTAVEDLGPYVRSGDNDLIPRISSVLGITVKKWYVGNGESPIRATQSGAKLFPKFARYSAILVRITVSSRWRHSYTGDIYREEF
jgi:hypothetical protein